MLFDSTLTGAVWIPGLRTCIMQSQQRWLALLTSAPDLEGRKLAVLQEGDLCPSLLLGAKPVLGKRISAGQEKHRNLGMLQSGYL